MAILSKYQVLNSKQITILATKLEDGDEVIGISLLSAGDILAGNFKVIILTKNGRPASSYRGIELKKTSRGVKAIKLDKDDSVCFATAVSPDTETFIYNDKELSAERFRNRKRADKGHKAKLYIII